MGHFVLCDVVEVECCGYIGCSNDENRGKFPNGTSHVYYWYAPGYRSSRSNCCHCAAGCNIEESMELRAEDGTEGQCAYRDVSTPDCARATDIDTFESDSIGFLTCEIPEGMTLADAFVRDTAERLGTSADRIYLLGFSQGSMIAHALLLHGAQSPAGVAACSGRMVDEIFAGCTDTDRLSGRRLFVSHGRFDDVIPVECGRSIRDWYARTGIDLDYHEYDMAHGIAPDCLADLGSWCTRCLDD
mgnify:CR=1 FL=1